jgi:uncharacterized protein (TIGR02001 family)
MKLLKKLTPLVTALAIAATVFGLPAAASADDFSGNIGVVSKYILRGGTANAESDGATMQGGFDYATNIGIYVGYWGSGLGYGDCEEDKDGACTSGAKTGFENDIYAGWSGDLGPVNLDAGVIYYYYLNVDNSDTAEVTATLGYGPVSFGFKYLTGDVEWGNAGDIYWTLGGEVGLPKDFTLGATIGYYTYEGSGKYVSGDKANLKHVDFVLSHPIGKTGADMTLTYVVGGKDRTGADLPDGTVLGISYGFGI